MNRRKTEKKLRTRFKLWLYNDRVGSAFGDGKWYLLKALNDKESLNAVVKSQKISYRKAWGDLKKAQEVLNIQLVKKRRGGNLGGQTVLTSEGKKWLEAYTKFRANIEMAAEKAYEKYISELLK